MSADHDIEFEGKRYTKEEFIYRPWEVSSNKRMKYCGVFYNLWMREKARKSGKRLGEASSYNQWTKKFIPFFSRLYTTKNNKKEPITWNDFKDLFP